MSDNRGRMIQHTCLARASKKRTSLSIACVGEAMIELSHTGSLDADIKPGFAGDTLNTAIYLKRLIGNNAAVSFVTALGTDPYSDHMMGMMLSENIATDYIERNPDRLPGLYSIVTGESGERFFYYWRDSSAARLMFQLFNGLTFDCLADFDIIYLSAITLAILPTDVRYSLLEWLKDYRRDNNKLFVFDSNYRPRLWPDIKEARNAISAAWSITDIALPSIDDEMSLFGENSEAEVLQRLRQMGISRGALKRGSLGPISLADEQTRLNFPAADNVIDTTAAGDSFNGAFLAALFSGRNESEAMLAGHQCASRVVSMPGAIIPKANMFPATSE
ncbi:MAG: sugar kinase [Granulosicoccus sp.]